MEVGLCYPGTNKEKLAGPGHQTARIRHRDEPLDLEGGRQYVSVPVCGGGAGWSSWRQMGTPKELARMMRGERSVQPGRSWSFWNSACKYCEAIERPLDRSFTKVQGF